MCKPFIQNHQYNRVVKQANRIIHSVNTVTDKNVIEAVRYNAMEHVIEPFQRKIKELIHEKLGIFY
jgi:Elongation factor G-binding protein, N-terminal